MTYPCEAIAISNFISTMLTGPVLIYLGYINFIEKVKSFYETHGNIFSYKIEKEECEQKPKLSRFEKWFGKWY